MFIIIVFWLGIDRPLGFPVFCGHFFFGLSYFFPYLPLSSYPSSTVS